MTILQIFCEAIENAIQTYEKSVKKVPVQRQTEICTLRLWLVECQQARIDSVAFRIKMVDYVSKMPAGLWAFIPAFDSRLRKNLQGVLVKFDFSEQQLSLKERTQDRDEHAQDRIHYQEQIDSMNGKITTLTDQLAKERAKDNVRTVNQLTNALDVEKQKNAFLMIENKKLEKNMSGLQENYDDLKAKYDTLLAERANASSASPNGPATNAYKPLLS